MPIAAGVACELCLATRPEIRVQASAATKRIPSLPAPVVSGASAQTEAPEHKGAGGDLSTTKRPLSDSFGELVGGKVWAN
jgi:hypothetical protein